jgi:hypothetical protein
VPGASVPFIDQWAPPQYVYGSTGGAGPVRSPDPILPAGGASVNTDSQSTYDGTITTKLAATIILALVVVFVLQGSGFRFVGAATVGFGR